jgi:hypothetical protein
MPKPIVMLLSAAILLALVSGCAPVGSERWCEKMRDTPRGELSVNDARDFAKHCLS